MNRRIFLPRLSVMGIRKNSVTYFPYIIAGILSVFVFFVFSSIIHNDIMKTLPHGSYLTVLMGIGLVLLGIVLVPFHVYINSFLIRRRKKELGLYSILGLEKKHIAIMMVWETLIIFSIVITGGILFGVVFSKLSFLVLLNLTGIPVNVSFDFSFNSIMESFLYFAAVYSLNLGLNLFQVYRSNPGDLMKGAKEGEKEPRHLWITALLSVILLTAGYYIAIVTKVDSMIFINFFLAAALVIAGTHNFFKAGVIALLKFIKRNKKLYYRKSNYVTISGMLYRMKKSASSLANICIFSTMTVITLLCTLSLWSGTDSILDHMYPYDVILNFKADSFAGYDALNEKLQEISEDTKVSIEDRIAFTYQKLHVSKSGKSFLKQNADPEAEGNYAIKLISLKDYNQIEKKSEMLEDNEMLVFATGSNFGYDSVVLNNVEYKIKKELEQSVFERKAVNDTFGQDYYLIVKDDAVLDRMRTEYDSDAESDRIYTMRFQLSGTEDKETEFINKLSIWCQAQKGFNGISNGISRREDTVSINGGLLFLGIFFGIVFSMCLILIMYYKQVTEGFDDRDNFSIMQKVGMSDKEVRGTIKRQILTVFFLPLYIAVFHTMAAFGIISRLLGVLNLFDIKLIVICGVVVLGFFELLYGLSYLITSRVYYRIVRQM